MEKVYVVGHVNPDTDTVIAAMSLASLLTMKDKMYKYVAAMAGKPNPETEYIFNRFGLRIPEILEDATDKKLFLVDHNESSQTVRGFKPENIIGIVDHHKIKFECPSPIEVTMKPWGSSNTIVYDMYKKEGFDVPKELRPAILCAILSDTIILKSPTTTVMDVAVVEELSTELGINHEELGMELFKAKSRIAEKTPKEIVHNDFKNFDLSGRKVGIGQIETPDLKEIEGRIPSVLGYMKQLKEDEGYDTVLLMVTDIMLEGSKLLAVSDDLNRIAKIFKTEFKENLSKFLPGIMSRKKQVASVLSEEY